MMTEEEKRRSHIEAVKKYERKNVTQIKFSFNNETDKEIIAHIKSQKNKQGYIKQLIKEDMRKQK
jgi:serine protease inhibitor